MKSTAFAVIALAAIALASFAVAGDWTPYGNARYNYRIETPPDFSKIEESENGDGGTSKSSDGRASLAVWGSYLTEGDFAGEVKWRLGQERSGDWSVAYQRHGLKWAVWSGSKGSRIYYERAISVCDGAAAYFRLEYDKTQAKTFDAVVTRLTKSLRSGDC